MTREIPGSGAVGEEIQARWSVWEFMARQGEGLGTDDVIRDRGGILHCYGTSS